MHDFANSTVAVTGGAGFIGSHLVQRLRSLRASVIVIDSLEYGKRENLVAGDPEIQIEKFKLGVDSRVRLQEILRGVDYVFHLAAQKHNQGIHSQEVRPNMNVVGTEHLLKACLATKVKKIIFTSSLYAYGRMTGPPMAESEVPAPNTIYGISKLQCEHACHRVSVQSRIPIICLRLFFTYGPRQSAQYPSVILKNFERMLNGQRPVIYGDGSQVFDYSYVDDVVDAILAASIHSKFGVFNVGSGVPTTINGLLYNMARIAGRSFEDDDGFYDTVSADWTAGSYRVADTAKFEAAFGTLPHTSLYEGLHRTFDWMKSRA